MYGNGLGYSRVGDNSCGFTISTCPAGFFADSSIVQGCSVNSSIFIYNKTNIVDMCTL